MESCGVPSPFVHGRVLSVSSTARGSMAMKKLKRSTFVFLSLCLSVGCQQRHPTPVEATPETPDDIAVLINHDETVSGEEQANARSEERRVGKECRSRWSPY